MEEWHGETTTPANNHEITIPTSIGDLRITLATRIARQLATTAPSTGTDATLGPTADGTTAHEPRTAEPPIHRTALPADAPLSTLAPASDPILSGTVRAPDSAATPVVPADNLHGEMASGPTAPPEALPPSAPLAEEPIPHPAFSLIGSDPTRAPVEVVDGLAQPRHYQASASPPPADSSSIAPMTPPMDCELTSQLRGVEYLLGDNCLLPVTSCTSCLQPFEVGETLVRLACMHFFHKECVTRWFSSPIHGHRCPCCNVNLIGLDSC